MVSTVHQFLTYCVRGACLIGFTAVLGACGGESSSTSTSAAAATTSAALQVELPSVEPGAATVAVQPTFHVAPVLLDEPDDADTVVTDASSQHGPHLAYVPTGLAGLSTRRLTHAALEAAAAKPAPFEPPATSPDAQATPLASGNAVATYTPAQIRAAYGLPPLPVAGASNNASQAALAGAGQTVYLIDAMDNPNVAAELAAFDQKFGLPGCTIVPIATNAALPLASATTTGCVLSVVYSTATGAMTASAPAYDSGWSTEISIDVQWVHATAPLARIVLIEAPDSSLNSLLAAINLANSMGHGVVSMSFGAPEGSWTASVDGAFTAATMTYIASTGDSGAGVNWPAVSTHVLAVGGTSLTYGGGTTRSEIAWSGTGGGVSSYTATPSYQTSAVPGMGVVAHRNVADVAFNADPSTGQYIAVMSPGSSAVGWLSAGGTSLAAPQWAAVLAISNAVRIQAAKAALGVPQPTLYEQIAATPASYASAFADVTRGQDGSCATCSARLGYDTVTGLGTPNVTALLPLLTGVAAVVAPPSIVGATASGTAGVPLSFTVTATAPDPLRYALSNSPSGMAINASGVVSWPVPVVGSYPVGVTVTDTVTGLSATASYKFTIAAPVAPVVSAATVTATAGVALAYQVSVAAADPVTLTLTGAPSGLTLSNAGILNWVDPSAGTFNVTVTAKDTATGLSGQAALKIVVGAAQPPSVGSASISGTAGSALSFAVALSSANPVTWSLAGAPAGMTIGGTGVVTWANPLAGNYAVTPSATDPKTGLSGQGTYKVTIAPRGPVITVAPLAGVAGKRLVGSIGVTDVGASSLSLSITGVPLGMTFGVSGQTITATWAAPIVGKYSLAITALDSAGLSAHATMAISITAN